MLLEQQSLQGTDEIRGEAAFGDERIRAGGNSFPFNHGAAVARDSDQPDTRERLP